MKTKDAITFEEFNKDYTLLKKHIAILKAKRKDVLKIAKSLAKAANKLYIFGNKNLYFEDEKGVHPVSKKLPKIMDDLEFWRTIDLELA